MALAVVTKGGGVRTREVETGTSDREANVSFVPDWNSYTREAPPCIDRLGEVADIDVDGKLCCGSIETLERDFGGQSRKAVGRDCCCKILHGPAWMSTFFTRLCHCFWSHE